MGWSVDGVAMSMEANVCCAPAAFLRARVCGCVYVSVTPQQLPFRAASTHTQPGGSICWGHCRRCFFHARTTVGPGANSGPSVTRSTCDSGLSHSTPLGAGVVLD